MSIYSFPARLGIHRSLLTFYAIIHRKFALQLFDIKLGTKVAYIIDQSLAKFQGDRWINYAYSKFYFRIWLRASWRPQRREFVLGKQAPNSHKNPITKGTVILKVFPVVKKANWTAFLTMKRKIWGERRKIFRNDATHFTRNRTSVLEMRKNMICIRFLRMDSSICFQNIVLFAFWEWIVV